MVCWLMGLGGVTAAQLQPKNNAMKLGMKPTEPTLKEPSEPKQESYPSLCLSDETASAFQKKHSLKMGQTVTATVKMKVCGMSEDKHGNSLRFDVMDLEPTGMGKNSKSMAAEYEDNDEETED